MPQLVESAPALLEALRERYGSLPAPGGEPWNRGDALPFESIVRAGRGLVAEPRVASAGFDVLRDAALLDPAALAAINPLELDELFLQGKVKLAAKALAPLRRIAGWANERSLDAETLARLSTEAIREDWRALNGVGPATADALLLFGLGRPTIPVDRASYRILVRHGWLDSSSDYDEARSTLESIAPDDPESLVQLSLGFGKIGRDACKPSGPKCDRCPLRPFLPEGGPVVEEA